MELNICMFGKRVFVWLDDGWYILNRANETEHIILKRHTITILRTDGIESQYNEKSDKGDGFIHVTAFSKEGVILYDFPLPYATFKYTSNHILQDDEEGLRLYNMLNDDIYNRPDYNKGGKQND